MERIKPRTLSGFMELLPADQAKLERFMETLRRTYSLYGFTALDTPVIEAAEVLLAKGGGDTEKQIYRFTKGDSDLALRFDLTVPLAKYVAINYANLSFPFRRYQIGKVYRGERAQRGRFREFYQADIDVIGDGKLDIINEAEIPSVIYRTFTSLGLERFVIRVNNRKILNGFYAMLGLQRGVEGILLAAAVEIGRFGGRSRRPKRRMSVFSLQRAHNCLQFRQNGAHVRPQHDSVSEAQRKIRLQLENHIPFHDGRKRIPHCEKAEGRHTHPKQRF